MIFCGAVATYCKYVLGPCAVAGLVDISLEQSPVVFVDVCQKKACGTPRASLAPSKATFEERLVDLEEYAGSAHIARAHG